MRNIPFTRSSKLSEDLGTSEMPEKGVDDKALLGKDNVRITNRIDNYGNQILEDVSGKNAGFGQFEVEVLEGVLKKGEMSGKKLSSSQTKSIEGILSSQPGKRIPGAPAGIGGTRMEEFTGATTYTEAEIGRATNVYTEELGTIDKYLSTEGISDEVRKALADEAAELDTQLEYEKAKMGTSLEELQTVKSIESANLKAGIEMSAADIKSASVNVTAPASEISEALAKTPEGINKGTGRSTTGLFGETKGILGDGGDVPKLDVKAKFETTDQGSLEISRNQAKLAGLERKLEGDIKLQDKFLEKYTYKGKAFAGQGSPSLRAEINSTKKDIKNTKAAITRRLAPSENLIDTKQTMTGVYRYTPGEESPGALIQDLKGQGNPSSIASAEPANAAGDFSYQSSEAGRLDAIKKQKDLDIKYDTYMEGPGISGNTYKYDRIKSNDSFTLTGGTKVTMNATGTAVSTPPKPAQQAINIGKIETTPKYDEIFNRAIKDFGGDVAKATVIATKVARQFYKRSPMIMTGLEVIPKAFNKFIDKDYSA